ncbi:hypothetical protein [Helicobacter suis]|nr:hypothetical protein [Helicobacter suis]
MGNAKAYFDLEAMYLNGGARKDPQKADEYFKKACELGYEEACKN